MLIPLCLRRRGAVGGHARRQREGMDRHHAGFLGAGVELIAPLFSNWPAWVRRAVAPVGPRKPPNGSQTSLMTSMGEQKLKTIGAQEHRPVTLGIDVSSAVLDVHLHPEGLRSRFANDACGHALLIGRATSHQPERVILKPTGAWHRALETAQGRASLPLVKGLPLRKQGSTRCRRTTLPKPVAPASRLTRLMFGHPNATGPSDDGDGDECWRGWLRACNRT